MENNKKVNVYILGAGASKEDGAPLIKEFFECAFTRIGGRIIPNPFTGKKEINADATIGLPDTEEEIRLYTKIAKKLDRFYGTEFQKDIYYIRTRGEIIIPSYSSKAKINVEDVLSELDESIYYGTNFHDITNIDEIKSLKTDLLYVIFDTLGNTIGSKTPKKNYLKFVNEILVPGEVHIIISLNYDVLLENALTDPEMFFHNRYQNEIFNIRSNKNEKSPWSYELDFIDIGGYEPCYSFKSNFVNVIKLHGSLNWRYCNKCKGLLLENTVNLLAYKDIIEKAKCPCCKTESSIEPFLIPPTRYKNLKNPIIKEMCEKSKNWLSIADTISVIGYSLPESDKHVLQLLSFAKYSNNNYVLNIANKSKVDRRKIRNLLSIGAKTVEEYCTFFEYLKDSDTITQQKN